MLKIRKTLHGYSIYYHNAFVKNYQFSKRSENIFKSLKDKKFNSIKELKNYIIFLEEKFKIFPLDKKSKKDLKILNLDNTSKINIPKSVVEIMQEIKNEGYEIWLVGGCVRDLHLGLKPKDWDLTGNFESTYLLKKYPNKSWCTNKYGTVSINTSDAGVLELTPYRKEGNYKDGRRPDELIFVGVTLKDDLKRRDFKMNSLVMDEKGNIKDLFGGLKDLKNRILNTVGSSKERYLEDYLRMLRAIRFVAKFDLDISKEELKILKELSYNIRNVSFERINVEFNKLLDSKYYKKGFEYLFITSIWKNIIRKCGVEKDTFEFNFEQFEDNVKDSFTQDEKIRLFFTIYDPNRISILNKLLKRLKYGSSFIKEHIFICKRLKNILEGSFNLKDEMEVFYNNSINFEELFVYLKVLNKNYILKKLKIEYNNLLNSGEPYLIKHLKINGDDMMKLGYSGKEIGINLNKLKELVKLNPHKNKKEILLKELKKS